tara:strand:+ start:1822 stop:2514 length:693 start_codon:yes stop_codon:yes gene_type:complete
MRWQPWFEDFSGIWQTNTGIRFGILFSPDSSLITIDTRQMPLRIVEADSVNGSVTFNINTRDPKAIRGWSDPTPEQQAKLKTFEISVSKFILSQPAARPDLLLDRRVTLNSRVENRQTAIRQREAAILDATTEADRVFHEGYIQKYAAEIEVLRTELAELNRLEADFDRNNLTMSEQPGSVEEWTLRKIWNENHTGFSLNLFLPVGSYQLGFVRTLRDQELVEWKKTKPF